MSAKETLLFHYKLCTFLESTSLLPVWDVHKNIRFLALSELSLSLWISCSNLTDCQAQRKFLTFNQATVSLSFLYLFTRIAPPPPILFYALSALSNHLKKSASLVFTEFLLLSLKKTPSHPSVLPFCSTPSFYIKLFLLFHLSVHQCSSTPLHHSRRLHSCTPIHINVPCTTMQPSWRKTSAAKIRTT